MTTLVCAPLYGPGARKNAKVVRTEIRRAGGAITGLTEAYPRPVRAELARIAGSRVVVGEGGKDRNRGQYDVPIVVSSRLRSMGEGQLFGAAAAPADAPPREKKLQPERWMTYAAEQIGSHCVGVLNLHPHPGAQAPDGSIRQSDLGDRYRAQMRRFDSTLLWMVSMGWLPVVMGDLNFEDRGHDPESPYAIMRRYGIMVTSHGIIALGASRRLTMKVEVFQPNKAVSDHVWLRGKI